LDEQKIKMREDLAYWIGFSKTSGIGPIRLRKLLDHFGDIRSAWEASRNELMASGLNKRSVSMLIKQRDTLDLESELKQIESKSVKLITWDDPNYPSLLLNIHNPPFLLYVRGELLPKDELALGVVGTRSASVYGKETTRQFVEGLAASGITIVSGLAVGIDTQAHKTTLDVGGRTIAVLGSGIDVIYPRRNKKLAHRIMENGAVISEFPLGTPPESQNFPQRNRIISGLSLGVLMVEGKKTSGAGITVRYALEQGREVFAVPGNISNPKTEGPNAFIQQGAKLITCIGDILEELNLSMVVQHTETKTIIPDTPTEALIVKHLNREPIHIDQLGIKTNLSPADISGALVMMELKGYVRHVGGMNYIIAR